MKNILIIEDEKGMQQIYRDMFTDENKRFRYDIVDDGMKGLLKIKQKEYDLIILDIIMQPMTGDSFFVHLRSDARTAKVPVLVISVLAPELLEGMERIDRVTFLQKPVTKKRLFEQIERAFDT